MPLSPATRLGPYEILSRIGAGGMGEVYRARDTRLDRIVAIKVLTGEIKNRPDLRQRFEREARVVSSLNHPHICTLHDVGQQDGIDFLVMEHLEGQTLAERLADGPVPLEEALRLAKQIVAALDQAHRHSVVHRDLKPANIMLTKSGAKLLDFGLAKLDSGLKPAGGGAQGEAATETAALTSEGAIIGTFRYMAPEQLEAREADARTDIFAFGVVLYEMVTGRRAFEGGSQASLIASILRAEPPPISSVQPLTPATLDRVVSRCLAKDPEDRWQSARDLGAALDYLLEPPAAATAPRPARPWLAWALVAAALLAAIALGVYTLTRPRADELVTRLSVAPPPGSRFVFVPQGGGSAISHDGRQLAFSAPLDGTPMLWMRPLDSPAARSLPGTIGAYYPFWSPDARSVGFFALGKLKRIDLATGAVRDIADVGDGRGGTWTADPSGKGDGVVIFAALLGPLMRVSAEGGSVTPVTQLDAGRQETQHWSPQALPGGKILYIARNRQGGGVVYASPLEGAPDSTKTVRLIDSGSNASYAPPWRGHPGYLLSVGGGNLLAYRFDATALRVDATPAVVAEGVGYLPPLQLANFSISSNGVLAYGSDGFEASQFRWLNREGKSLSTVGEPGVYPFFRLSPDETKVVVTKLDPSGRFSVWVFEAARNVQTRITFMQGGAELSPVWSPDGKQVAFSARVGGPFRVHVQPLAGGKAVALTEGRGTHFVNDWSKDGRFIVYSETNEQSMDLWVLPMLPTPSKPFPYLQTAYQEGYAQISPDGRRLAYTSNESGRSEVYLQNFPTPGNKLQVSNGGGSSPRWRGDGKELFYASGNRLMAVPVNPNNPASEAGVPQELFTWNASLLDGTFSYSASADGRRFLVSSLAEATPKPMTVVLNWQAGLK